VQRAHLQPSYAIVATIDACKKGYFMLAWCIAVEHAAQQHAATQ
jgi:hypothetical protein